MNQANLNQSDCLQKTLVTGANGGIGRALATRLVNDGHQVVLADQASDSLTQLGEQLGCQVIAGDLGDKAYCDNLPRQAQTAMGGLTGLCNNAGIMRRGEITETSDIDYDLSMQINVEAPFRLCRAAIPLMAKGGGGAIVNTASCWGLYPGPAHLIYCVSKGALATMTKCLGRDHAAQNIRVNAVCPNEVNTPMLRTGFSRRGLNPDTAIEALNQSVPLGRIAEPAEIADVIAYLLSAQASYITGACLEINGGKPVY